MNLIKWNWRTDTVFNCSFCLILNLEFHQTRHKTACLISLLIHFFCLTLLNFYENSLTSKRSPLNWKSKTSSTNIPLWKHSYLSWVMLFNQIWLPAADSFYPCCLCKCALGSFISFCKVCCVPAAAACGGGGWWMRGGVGVRNFNHFSKTKQATPSRGRLSNRFWDCVSHDCSEKFGFCYLVWILKPDCLSLSQTGTVL